MTGIVERLLISAADCEEAADEIERLQALSQNNARSWDLCVRERDEARAEIERLRGIIAFMEAASKAERDGLVAEIERQAAGGVRP